MVNVITSTTHELDDGGTRLTGGVVTLIVVGLKSRLMRRSEVVD